ncbi:MAG: CDGSH iron-sulfur domain-containing protein [Methylococcales bacterium]|nr:CDGSH iron-sulfur domain-containing protein [Methylococcales bacterium]
MATKTNSPLPVDIEAGETYLWCACGLSQTTPLCDGSHKGTGQKPVSFVAEETKTAYLCACTLTEAAPLCDGSHCKAMSF